MLRLVAVMALAIVAGPAVADPIEAGLSTGAHAAEAIILTGPIGALFVLVVVGLVFALGAAGFVIRALWNTIKERDAGTAQMRKDYETALAAVQEKRAAELVESTKQVASTAISGASAITSSNEKLAGIEARLLALVDRISPLNGDHQRIIANQEKILDVQAGLLRSAGRGAA